MQRGAGSLAALAATNTMFSGAFHVYASSSGDHGAHTVGRVLGMIGDLSDVVRQPNEMEHHPGVFDDAEDFVFGWFETRTLHYKPSSGLLNSLLPSFPSLLSLPISYTTPSNHRQATTTAGSS